MLDPLSGSIALISTKRFHPAFQAGRFKAHVLVGNFSERQAGKAAEESFEFHRESDAAAGVCRLDVTVKSR